MPFIQIPSQSPTDTDDEIQGTDASEVIDAGAGNDIINGKGGHDTLVGGPGQDIFVFTNIVAHGPHPEGGYEVVSEDGLDVIVDLSPADGDEIINVTDEDGPGPSPAASYRVVPGVTV